MSDRMKRTLRRAGFGFLLGVTVGNLISALSGGDVFSSVLMARAGSQAAAMLWHTLFSGLLGAVSMGGVSFYELDRWPLLCVALAHYALIEAAYIPIAFFLGWLSGAREALIWMGYSAAAYLLIFLIMYARYRKQVKELNTLQKSFLDKKQQNNGGNV